MSTLDIGSLLRDLGDFINKPEDRTFEKLRTNSSLAKMSKILCDSVSAKEVLRLMNAMPEPDATNEAIWLEQMTNLCESVHSGDMSMALLHAVRVREASDLFGPGLPNNMVRR